MAPKIFLKERYKMSEMHFTRNGKRISLKELTPGEAELHMRTLCRIVGEMGKTESDTEKTMTKSDRSPVPISLVG